MTYNRTMFVPSTSFLSVMPQKRYSFSASSIPTCTRHVGERIYPFKLRIERQALPYLTNSCRSKRTVIATATAAATTISIPKTSNPAHVRILHLVSSIIGVLVLIGSVLYKIPQIIRIIRRRSARGLSILYYALELVGMTFSFVYFARRNYPILSYGENCAVTVSNIIILGLILNYGPAQPRWVVVLSAAVYTIAILYLSSTFAPISLLMTLQVLSIPLLNLAKVPQILKNHAAQSTGELSQLTLFLQLLGNVARIFTTIAQVRDGLMLASTLVAFCFNAVLFGQWFLYSRPIPLAQKP